MVGALLAGGGCSLTGDDDGSGDGRDLADIVRDALDEATLAVFTARDVPGTPWTDPAAHGSGFERTRAFGDGFEAGAKSCDPAPADDWVIAQS